MYSYICIYIRIMLLCTRTPPRAIGGYTWDFPGDARAMIGRHPCHVAGKDLVVPVYASPHAYLRSPWLADPNRTVWAPRRTLAYFSGNLAYNEPLKYSRGIRHRLRAAFGSTTGWRLVGNAGEMRSWRV